MKEQFNERQNLAWLIGALGLGLILVISVFSFFSGRRYIESNKWQRHAEGVIDLTHTIQIALERSETTHRGFLLTGKESFLETYRNSVKYVQEGMTELARSVANSEIQSSASAQLGKLIRQRVALLDENILLIENGLNAKVLDNLKRGTGGALMTRIRESFDEFVAAESRLLKERMIEAETAFTKTSVIVFSGLLCAFLLLLFVTTLLRAEIRRRNAAEAQANEASALKSQFLANMSHEIRTPLNGIIGMIKILSDSQLNSRQQEYVETIRDSSNALLVLINQILDLSKIESGKLQLEETHFELRSLVSGTASILAPMTEAKGLRVVTTIADDVPDMYIADPLRLRQILLNLLNNAIKFSSSGIVELKVGKGVERDSLIELNFDVVDQGVGINKETQNRLFQFFTQGDQSTTRLHGGTGLGLASRCRETLNSRTGASSRL